MNINSANKFVLVSFILVVLFSFNLSIPQLVQNSEAYPSTYVSEIASKNLTLEIRTYFSAFRQPSISKILEILAGAPLGYSIQIFSLDDVKSELDALTKKMGESQPES